MVRSIPSRGDVPTLALNLGFTKSVLGILFTFWVMGFLIYKQKGSFFLPRGTGIKFIGALGRTAHGFRGYSQPLNAQP